MPITWCVKWTWKWSRMWFYLFAYQCELKDFSGKIEQLHLFFLNFFKESILTSEWYWGSRIRLYWKMLSNLLWDLRAFVMGTFLWMEGKLIREGIERKQRKGEGMAWNQWYWTKNLNWEMKYVNRALFQISVVLLRRVLL